ncbi:MAG: hypothetical protein SVR08_16055 [Spirochaetota bacterium]|nr:hypothetical protein [Spirochaetota bacterium]
MMKHFQEGQEVYRIWLNDELFIGVGDNSGCEKITVVIESNGSIWFAVWINGEITVKYNAAFVDSVVLKNG